MGHLVMDTFWEQALHQNSALLFTLALSRLERVAVTNVPYQIHHHTGRSRDTIIWWWTSGSSQETEARQSFRTSALLTLIERRSTVHSGSATQSFASLCYYVP